MHHGVKGTFEIKIKSNQKCLYQIIFESKNKKPVNLKFRNKETGIEKTSLEELGKELSGEIDKKEEKILTINWYWNYENGEQGNKQDTKDAQTISNYQFDIKVIGKGEIEWKLKKEWKK